MRSISSKSFYSEYYGHPIQDLQMIIDHVRNNKNNDTNIIWTAGDSSLDNKYWFHDTISPAISNTIYSQLLKPSIMKPDVTFWFNELLQQQQHQSNDNNNNVNNENVQQKQYVAINTAVEATTINERTFHLREHDILIRNNIKKDDILIVSIGGNDIAMSPLVCTACSIVSLIYCIPTSFIQHTNCITTTSCYTIPYDDYCYGFGCSLLSCCSTPFVPCLGYLYHMFHIRIQKYIERIISGKEIPSKIIICTIYYPDEYQYQNSWANLALSCLQYNTNPNKIQTLIRTIHYNAISKTRIANNTNIIPIALYIPLNGKIRSDYVQRVEPSPLGGKKMAEYILQKLDLLSNIPSQQQVISSSDIGDNMISSATKSTTVATNMTLLWNHRHHHHDGNNNSSSSKAPYQSFMTDRE